MILVTTSVVTRGVWASASLLHGTLQADQHLWHFRGMSKKCHKRRKMFNVEPYLDNYLWQFSDARCVLDVAADFPRPSQSVTKIMIWIRDLTIQSPLCPAALAVAVSPCRAEQRRPVAMMTRRHESSIISKSVVWLSVLMVRRLELFGNLLLETVTTNYT